MALVSQADYARHRGVSEAAVNKAWKRGRIKKDARGLIDQEQADRDWEAKSDKRQQRKPKAKPAPASPTPILPAGPEAETDDGDFAEAQRQHEWEKVWKDRMARKVREGQLLERVDVQKTIERARDAIKNRLLLLEAKVPAEARAATSREVRAALNELAEFNFDAA